MFLEMLFSMSHHSLSVNSPLYPPLPLKHLNFHTTSHLECTMSSGSFIASILGHAQTTLSNVRHPLLTLHASHRLF